MSFNSWKSKMNVIFFYIVLFLSAFSSFAGTGDFAGGGNGSKYKVYESNIEPLVKLPAYTNRVKPLMEKFDILMNELGQNEGDKKFPYSEFLTKMKLWYFSDDTLNSIDKETLGVIFNKEKTQQIALNKKREIWIDNKIFEKMKEEHQADLIVHEIVMNLYFFKYYSFYDICLMGKEMGLYDDKEENNISCDQVKDVQYFKTKETMALNEDDYQNIRRVTDWFLKELKTAKADDLYNKIMYNNFDKRLITRTDNKKDIQLKGAEVEKIINESFITDSFPDTCKSTLSSTPLDCVATVKKTTSHSLTFNKLEFNITNGTETKKIAFNITRAYSTYQSPLQTHQGITYYSVYFNSHDLPLELSHEVGQRFYILTLYFTLKQGTNISTSELIAYSLVPMTITQIAPKVENTYYSDCEIKKLNQQKHPSFYWGRNNQSELITDLSIQLTYFSKSACFVRTPEQIQKEAIQNKKITEVKQKVDSQIQPLIGKTFEFKNAVSKWGKDLTSISNSLPQQDYHESRMKSCITNQKDKNRECISAKTLKILSLETALINNQIECSIHSFDSSKMASTTTKIHSKTGFRIYFICPDTKYEINGLPAGNFYYSKDSLLVQEEIMEYNNNFYQNELYFSEVNGN